MTGKTILLVEDNKKIMQNNKTALIYRGAKVETATTIAAARSLITEKLFDAAVFDIMLPDGSGFDLLRDVRAVSNLPILMLTAKSDSEDIIKGLTIGADDYLAKPYDLNVLAARIDALLRRTYSAASSAQIIGIDKNIAIGSLRFDLISSQALYVDKDLLLTQKEFALLLLLAQNERKILSMEYLFEKVWKRQLGGDTIALRSQISNLKKKISAVTGNILIESLRSEGYFLTIL
jgi:DNA-binding response OmpR family regulator